MRVRPQETALMVYLNENHDIYHGKILELRDAVQRWLEYIPQSFPQYTRHTIQHSDEIVLQLSKLLFRDDNPTKPVIQLSAVEAYILIASAYLHDVGMVISDKEKAEILASSGWKEWIAESGGGYKRYTQIKAFRSSQKPTDKVVRNFLADVQMRYLLADYVRRQHHMRGMHVIAMHRYALGRFGFDDPILIQTITRVCVAHGLTHNELDDNELYPDRCDIQGEKVNVRLLAILLRIGDLLDMSYDRACPLLLNAVSPLPAESLAHWTKYQRITNRLTAPDRIELSAKCLKQEEHRFLQDWCQWLVDEIREASVMKSRMSRHNDWVPPTINLEGHNQTISIHPAENAKYIPSKWTFEMDENAVFNRLMRDIYGNPMRFVLELVQNALDATRCQMYIDLEKDGLELPEYPTQVEENRRFRYPIKISLGTTEVLNELSGETETRQVLVIEDCGIGMDREIIKKYFLQVGRSYYKTDEFRRSFRFVPNSRFGIGFLSVFGVSDNVIVETYKPSSRRTDGAIRLTLRGPRNYLLTERGNRQSHGTRIEVVLREPTKRGMLIESLTYWCKRVEFPIFVDELGDKKTIIAERAEQISYELPDFTEKGAKFILRAFPINQSGIEGELYIVIRKGKEGESWDKKDYVHYDYPRTHPAAFAPPIPKSLVLRNGIRDPNLRSIEYGRFGNNVVHRLDVRCKIATNVSLLSILKEVILSKLEEILKEHLTTESKADLPDASSYKQNLVRDFSSNLFWDSYPKTVKIWIKGQTKFISLKEAASFPSVTTILDLTKLTIQSVGSLYRKRLDVEEVALFDNDSPTFTNLDIRLLSHRHRRSIFMNRKPINVRWLKSNHLAIDWMLSLEEKMDILYPSEISRMICPSSITKLPDPHTFGFFIHTTIVKNEEHILLNSDHPLVRWFLRIRNSQLGPRPPLERKEFERLQKLIRYSILFPSGEYVQDLPNFLKWLSQSKKLSSPHTIPRRLKITQDIFLLRPPKHKRAQKIEFDATILTQVGNGFQLP